MHLKFTSNLVLKPLSIWLHAVRLDVLSNLLGIIRSAVVVITETQNACFLRAFGNCGFGGGYLATTRQTV